MSRLLVYDLPTRIFHWAIAGLFVFAFFIAKTIDDESSVFTFHMLAGIMLSVTVLLRIIWGFVGTSHARFSSFALNPIDLVQYFKGLLSGKSRKWAGHNPASSWAAIAMFGLALGLGLTGYFMSNGFEETFEDIHELLANAFLLVTLLHVAGVVLHSVRHRDAIGLSMLDGKKQAIQTSDAIPGSKPFVGLALILILSAVGAFLVQNYDAASGQLRAFGQTLQLGDSNGGSEVSANHLEKDEDDD